MTLLYTPGGRCPYCGSLHTETSPHGVRVCIRCGRSW